MSLTRTQAAYPDEGAARQAVERELEWVKAHVLEGKKDGLARVEDVQQFVITAPGPGSEGAHAKTQRESSSSSFDSFEPSGGGGGDGGRCRIGCWDVSMAYSLPCRPGILLPRSLHSLMCRLRPHAPFLFPVVRFHALRLFASGRRSPDTLANHVLALAAPHYPNPQTAAFCAMLQIENKVDLVAPGGGGS